MNIDKIKLSPSSTIKEALEIIDSGAVKITLVVDENGKLLGTITDGDIRRAILKGKRLEDNISNIYYKNPVTVSIDESKENIINLCTSKKIYQIPVVDKEGKVVKIILLDEILKPKEYPNKVVLMVGGLGTRLRPLTENIPKPMLSVGGKPILQTIIEQFRNYGFKNFILCVNYKADIIKNYFQDGNKFGVNIEYVIENKRMGTAGALGLLKEKPKEPFFVMNGDILTNVNFENMLEYHTSHNSTATMAVREYDFQIPFGVVKMKDNEIKAIEEKPVYKFFVSAGIYILNPECIVYIPKDEFYDMPILFEDLIKDNKKTHSFPIREYWMDIGRLEEYEKATKEYIKVFE